MEKTSEKYIGATGRRKTSVARVRITPATKFSMEVNGRDFDQYFPVAELRRNITATFDAAEITQKFKVTVKVSGGGISSQSVAVSHGIARALEAYDKELRGKLKAKGLLKRDPRSVERKKFGLKKARKAPTWSKR
jgi:small subunit ribosomal protein S9